MIRPVLQALVLADHIYQDKNTGKMVIAGTFNRLLIIKSNKGPAENQDNFAAPQESPRKMAFHEISRTGSPFAYISLTGVHGSIPLELRYTDLLDNKPLFVIQFTVSCDDPLKSIEANVAVPPLPTPHAGAYALELMSNNELIGSHRIVVDEAMPPAQISRSGSQLPTRAGFIRKVGKINQADYRLVLFSAEMSVKNNLHL